MGSVMVLGLWSLVFNLSVTFRLFRVFRGPFAVGQPGNTRNVTKRSKTKDQGPKTKDQRPKTKDQRPNTCLFG